MFKPGRAASKLQHTCNPSRLTLYVTFCILSLFPSGIVPKCNNLEPSFSNSNEQNKTILEDQAA